MRVVVGLQGQPNVQIEASDLDRVTSRTGQLNNFALNGIAAALLNLFGHPTSPNAATANKCAILSTYDLPRVCYKCNDEKLWRHVHPTSYWDKPIWLIPIHWLSEEHWVLVVVSVPEQQLFFFDSLGEQSGW
jgi:hypothetical protein